MWPDDDRRGGKVCHGGTDREEEGGGIITDPRLRIKSTEGVIWDRRSSWWRG